MSKIRDTLNKVAALLRKMVVQHTAITIGVAGLLLTFLAFPQIQALFKSHRDVVQSLGYQWNAQSLEQAIQSEDSDAVEAFVQGKIRIPDRVVWLVMDGKAIPGFDPQDERPFSEDIVTALAESKNIEASACESLLSRTGVLQPAWVSWVGEKPEYKRFFGAVCNTSAGPYARLRQKYQESYDRQAAEMSDLVAIGHCQPSQEVTFSCVHFYALLPRSLSEARSKLEMIYRLDCAISSDRKACARIKDGRWELPPPNPATSIRARAVQNQCVSELKKRYSCEAFFEHIQASNILISDDPEHLTLDQPLEMASAIAQATLLSGQANGESICQIYEDAIQKGCQQASMASISDPPSGGN